MDDNEQLTFRYFRLRKKNSPVAKPLAKFRLLCYTKPMKYDYKALYEKNAAFYQFSPTRLKGLKLLNGILTWLFAVAYTAFWLYAIKSDKLPLQELVSPFFAPALALIFVSAIRLGVDRPRPYSKNGANITPLVAREDRDGDSFPSRHIACAAAIATVFLSVLPIIGVLLWFCCFALAYIRFSIGVHYPSDLAAGILLGAVCGITVFM